MISKKDAGEFIRNRDRAEVDKWLAELDEAVRTRYKGVSVSVQTTKDISSHVIDILTMELQDLGWKLKYSPPGSDMRGDKWNGSLTIS